MMFIILCRDTRESKHADFIIAAGTVTLHLFRSTTLSFITGMAAVVAGMAMVVRMNIGTFDAFGKQSHHTVPGMAAGVHIET